jgi:hypothetical protein
MEILTPGLCHAHQWWDFVCAGIFAPANPLEKGDRLFSPGGEVPCATLLQPFCNPCTDIPRVRAHFHIFYPHFVHYSQNTENRTKGVEGMCE